MKIIDPWQQKSSRLRKILYILFIIFSMVFIIIMLLPILLVLLIFLSPWEESLYKVHHPAIYYVQDNFFKLGENVYYMKDEKCVSFDDKKEIRQMDLEHISDDFYVTNDILYVYLDGHIYAYNSNLEEISIYDTGFIDLSDRICFIVLGDYIYLHSYNHDIKEYEIYKYSMITHTKEALNGDGQYPTNFTSEGIYYNGLFHKYDDNIHYCTFRGGSEVLYNENYEKIEITKEFDGLVINDNYLNFETPFTVKKVVYLNSDYIVFSTYTPQTENCSDIITPCISQLTNVKLWKYNYKTEQLSLIKQFNDYTILVSFDDNNFQYYYDGKLYSNDIEVEEAPKIEVGDMFTYYTTESTPNLYREEIRKSTTSIAYISGEFYIIHEEKNSDLEEFHGR